MISKFDDTDLLSVAFWQGRKRVETEGIVALAVEEATMESAHGTCNVPCMLCCTWHGLTFE